MYLDDLTQIETHAKAIAGDVAPGGRVQVHLREGVPRGRLLDQIGRALPGAAIVALPPLNDPDASLHGLLQSAAPLGPQAVEAATQDGVALRDRARATGQALARAGRPLVVWVPPSWSVSDDNGDPDQQLRCQAAEHVLGGWLSAEDLRVVTLAHASSAGLMERSAGAAARRDHVIEPLIAALPEDSAWGSYAEAAASLRKGLTFRSNLKLSGVQLRLLVALVGLGRAPGYLLGERLGSAWILGDLAGSGHRKSAESLRFDHAHSAGSSHYQAVQADVGGVGAHGGLVGHGARGVGCVEKLTA